LTAGILPRPDYRHAQAPGLLLRGRPERFGDPHGVPPPPAKPKAGRRRSLGERFQAGAEGRSRHEKAIAQRIKDARFPDLKTLEQVDWEALQGVTKTKLLELSRGEWIERHEDLCLARPIGTGKTHLAIALGVEAAKRRFRVAFTRAADLVRSLLEARDARTLTRLNQRLQRAHLLVIDELGFVPFDRAGGELLFNLMSERHERRSTLLTTNLAFGEWVRVFGDEKLTTALLDRLGHHAHILTTKGPSYRARRRTVKD
jgi:DNA replication protein DnaC